MEEKGPPNGAPKGPAYDQSGRTKKPTPVPPGGDLSTYQKRPSRWTPTHVFSLEGVWWCLDII